MGSGKSAGDRQACGGCNATGEDECVVDAAGHAPAEGAGDGDEHAALARQTGVVDRGAQRSAEQEAEFVAEAAPACELHFLDRVAQEARVLAEPPEALPR